MAPGRDLPARPDRHAGAPREEGPADPRRGQAQDPPLEEGRRGLGALLHRDPGRARPQDPVPRTSPPARTATAPPRPRRPMRPAATSSRFRRCRPSGGDPAQVCRPRPATESPSEAGSLPPLSQLKGRTGMLRPHRRTFFRRDGPESAGATLFAGRGREELPRTARKPFGGAQPCESGKRFGRRRAVPLCHACSLRQPLRGPPLRSGAGRFR